MDITVSQHEGKRPVTVLTVTGTVDSATHDKLEEEGRAAHAAGSHDLVIDLKDVDYVSSAGIRTLNTLIKLLQTNAPEDSQEAMSQGLRDGTWKSPHLKIANSNKYVRETFKISGMDMLVEMYDSLDKALASF